MIILDTNVLSELMRVQPHPTVFAWVAAQSRDELYTTSINQAEILYGIAALPSGRRRDALAEAAEAIFVEDLAGRILPFDSKAAVHYAGAAATRRRSGLPIEGLDMLIAAIALAAKATVATRDVAGFIGSGLTIVDPWSAP